MPAWRVGRHQVRGCEVVDRHSVLASQPGEAAASVRPAIPVVELIPNGVASPCACLAASI
jgi:hypothetical protein